MSELPKARYLYPYAPGVPVWARNAHAGNHLTVTCVICLEAHSFFDELEVHLRAVLHPGVVLDLGQVFGALAIISANFRRYLAHRLRDVQQTAALKQLKLSLRPEQALIVTDFKNKVLLMANRESASDFYGKAGISLLGFMITVPEVLDGEAGFRTVFLDMVCEGDSKQDAVHVQLCLLALLKVLPTILPQVTRLTIQSDNAGCFSCKTNLPFIHLANKNLVGAPVIEQWIFTESQAGKTQQDGHFSYVQACLRRCQKEENVEIRCAQHVYECLSSKPVAGSIPVLVNVGDMRRRLAPDPFKDEWKTGEGTGEIYDVIFQGAGGIGDVQLREFTGVGTPRVLEVARLRKLRQVLPNNVLESELIWVAPGEVGRFQPRAVQGNGKPVKSSGRGSMLELVIQKGPLATENREQMQAEYVQTRVPAAGFAENGWARKERRANASLCDAAKEHLNARLTAAGPKGKLVFEDELHKLLGVLCFQWKDVLLCTLTRVKAYAKSKKGVAASNAGGERVPVPVPQDDDDEPEEEAWVPDFLDREPFADLYQGAVMNGGGSE